MIEQAADGIVVVDVGGRVSLANSRACEMLGCSAPEVVGLYLLDHGKIVAQGTPSAVIRVEVLAPVYGVRLVCGRHPTANVPTVELDPEVWS